MHTVRSGLKAVGSKTTTWAHWLFDGESGAAVAAAEASGFDLCERSRGFVLASKLLKNIPFIRIRGMSEPPRNEDERTLIATPEAFRLLC